MNFPEKSTKMSSPEKSSTINSPEKSTATDSTEKSTPNSSPGKSTTINPSIKSTKSTAPVDSPIKSTPIDSTRNSTIVNSRKKSRAYVKRIKEKNLRLAFELLNLDEDIVWADIKKGTYRDLERCETDTSDSESTISMEYCSCYCSCSECPEDTEVQTTNAGLSEESTSKKKTIGSKQKRSGHLNKSDAFNLGSIISKRYCSCAESSEDTEVQLTNDRLSEEITSKKKPSSKRKKIEAPVRSKSSKKASKNDDDLNLDDKSDNVDPILENIGRCLKVFREITAMRENAAKSFASSANETRQAGTSPTKMNLKHPKPKVFKDKLDRRLHALREMAIKKFASSVDETRPAEMSPGEVNLKQTKQKNGKNKIRRTRKADDAGKETSERVFSLQIRLGLPQEYDDKLIKKMIGRDQDASSSVQVESCPGDNDETQDMLTELQPEISPADVVNQEDSPLLFNGSPVLLKDLKIECQCDVVVGASSETRDKKSVKSNVDQLVKDSKDLTEANSRFQDVINDPLHEPEDESGEHSGDDTVSQRFMQNITKTADPSARQCDVVVGTSSEIWDKKPVKSNVDQLVKDSRHVLKDLTEANSRFQDVIKDPLHESEDESGEHSGDDTGSQRGNDKRKYWLAAQKNAEKIQWSSDDESVSDLSSQQRKTTPQKKKQKKTVWTEEEMDWIRIGVRKFGYGYWASIRDYFPFQGSHRNHRSIRDKYRTMKKNGQIIHD